MTIDELRALTRRMLDQLDIAYGWSDEHPGLVAAGDGDAALFFNFAEIEDSQGTSWPIVCLDTSILEDINRATIPAGLIGELNLNLVVGKVAVEDDRLALQHEMVGWPGSAEYRVAMEILLSHQAELCEDLAEEIEGSRPTPYSEIVAD